MPAPVQPERPLRAHLYVVRLTEHDGQGERPARLLGREEEPQSPEGQRTACAGEGALQRLVLDGVGEGEKQGREDERQ